MPAIDPRLVIVFVWIAACSIASFRLLSARFPRLPDLNVALVVAFLARIVPALILPRGAQYEMGVFHQAAQLTLDGRSVYLSDIAHPYFPLQLYWFAASLWLQGHVGLSFVFWLKVPSILAETAITSLIYFALRRRSTHDEAIFGSWFYALNPITILVAAYQGQFDAIPLFLAVAAWYVFEFDIGRKWAVPLSALLLGAGILSKTWPVILLPIILLRLPSRKQCLRYILISLAIPIAGILFFESLFPGSLGSILKRALSVGAISGWWGYSAVLNVLVELTGRGQVVYSLTTQIGKIVALICGLLVMLVTRRRPALYALLLTLLTMFALMPNLGLQGLSWIVVLGILLGMYNELGWYTAGVLIYMIVSYWGTHLTDGLYLLLPDQAASVIIQLSSLPAWGVVVVWWSQMLLGRSFLPRVFAPFGVEPESS
jgi:hypothetical protein